MAEIIEDFNYTPLQQLYCLSAASNAVGLKKGTQGELQQGMQVALNKHIPKLNGSKGDWKVTWGPAVYKSAVDLPQWGPTNAWFVAKSEAQKLCCVAIAGTAFHSFEAWIKNVAILRVVDFDQWVSKWKPSTVPRPPVQIGKPGRSDRCLAAYGTCSFVYNIVNFKSPRGAASAGKALGEYLQSETAGYDVVFTGHSMGGAVSPAAALGLLQTRVLDKAKSVKVLPSAGATPGNAVFTDRFKSAFPRSGDYNTNLYNKLDMVPQAFSTDLADDRNFDQILKIYDEAEGEALKYLQRGVALIGSSVRITMPYANLPGSSFVGRPVGKIKTKDDFFDSLRIQHGDDYWIKLGIKAFVDTIDRGLAKEGLEDLDLTLDYDEEMDKLQAAIDAVERGEDPSQTEDATE